MGNVCRSLLYELLDVLSPDLAAVLPHARTSFFLGRDGEDRWVGLFPDGCRSHVRGWVSDRGIASGKTLTLVRKTFMVVGQVGAGISLAACVVSGPALPVVCLLLAAAFWGISAGKWTGLQNFLGNLAGWIAPVVTGLVVDKTGRFFWAFIITAVIALLGSLSWIFIVGTLRQVDWSARPAYADSR